jgi:hypothetical protein
MGETVLERDERTGSSVLSVPVLRRAAVRWLLLGPFLVFLGFVVDGGKSGGTFLAACRFFLGFVTVPITCIELAAAKRSPSRSRDAITALLTGLVAWVSCSTLFFQVAYAVGVVAPGKHGADALAHGLEQVALVGRELSRSPLVLVCFVFPAAVFVPVVLGRLHAGTVSRQVVSGLFASMLASAVLAGVCMLGAAPGPKTASVIGIMTPVMSALMGGVLPVVYRLADTFEEIVVG